MKGRLPIDKGLFIEGTKAPKHRTIKSQAGKQHTADSIQHTGIKSKEGTRDRTAEMDGMDGTDRTDRTPAGA